MQPHRTGRDIARFPALSKHDFYQTLHRSEQPFILQDAVRTWPAWSKWSFAWLRAHHGDLVLPVEWLRYGRQPGTTATRLGRVEDKPLAAFIDSLLDGTPGDKGYVIGPDILLRIPSLLDDIQFPPYHDLERLVERIAFIGGQGTYTQLHYDRAHNLHAVLVGRKRWQLYSPAQQRRLRPVKLSFVWSVVSDHDLVPVGGRIEDITGDPDEVPGGVTPDYDFVLEAGEMLFLPYGWWHRVLTMAPSIAVNYWWWPLGMVAKRAPFLLPSLVASRVKDRLRHPIRRGYYGK